MSSTDLVEIESEPTLKETFSLESFIEGKNKEYQIEEHSIADNIASEVCFNSEQSKRWTAYFKYLERNQAIDRANRLLNSDKRLFSDNEIEFMREIVLGAYQELHLDALKEYPNFPGFVERLPEAGEEATKQQLKLRYRKLNQFNHDLEKKIRMQAQTQDRKEWCKKNIWEPLEKTLHPFEKIWNQLDTARWYVTSAAVILLSLLSTEEMVFQNHARLSSALKQNRQIELAGEVNTLNELDSILKAVPSPYYVRGVLRPNTIKNTVAFARSDGSRVLKPFMINKLGNIIEELGTNPSLVDTLENISYLKAPIGALVYGREDFSNDSRYLEHVSHMVLEHRQQLDELFRSIAILSNDQRIEPDLAKYINENFYFCPVASGWEKDGFYTKRGDRLHEAHDYWNGRNGPRHVFCPKAGRWGGLKYLPKWKAWYGTINHFDGTVTSLVHLDKNSIKVKDGQYLNELALIGEYVVAGKEPHIHCKYRKSGRPVDLNSPAYAIYTDITLAELVRFAELIFDSEYQGMINLDSRWREFRQQRIPGTTDENYGHILVIHDKNEDLLKIIPVYATVKGPESRAERTGGGG